MQLYGKNTIFLEKSTKIWYSRKWSNDRETEDVNYETFHEKNRSVYGVDFDGQRDGRMFRCR